MAIFCNDINIGSLDYNLSITTQIYAIQIIIEIGNDIRILLSRNIY